MPEVAQDILINSDYDLLIQSGDIVVGESDQQHIALCVLTGPGHWKENPFFGFNAPMYEGANVNQAEMQANLIEQLTTDNAVLDKFVTKNGFIIDIAASRTIV